MVVSEIELYEILSAKIGKPEAKALTEFVEAKVEKKWLINFLFLPLRRTSLKKSLPWK